MFREKVQSQRQDVFLSLVEGWQRDRKHAQAVVQVRPERSGLDQTIQPAVRRGHEPRFHPLLGRGAERPEGPLVDHSQERDLASRRQGLYLVQEQRASGRPGNQTLPSRVRVRERPPLMAEQLAFEQRVDE